MEISSTRGRHFSWAWIALLWAGLGIFDAAQNVFGMWEAEMHHSWAKLFLVLTFNWVPWALATPLVAYLGRRFPVSWSSVGSWAVHLSAAAAIDVVSAAWGSVLELLMEPWLPDFQAREFLAAWPMKISGGLLPALIIYTIVVAVTYALDDRARAAEQQTHAARLNEQLSNAKLTALQRQIEPHFMFNTLNAIA